MSKTQHSGRRALLIFAQAADAVLGKNSRARLDANKAAEMVDPFDRTMAATSFDDLSEEKKRDVHDRAIDIARDAEQSGGKPVKAHKVTSVFEW